MEMDWVNQWSNSNVREMSALLVIDDCKTLELLMRKMWSGEAAKIDIKGSLIVFLRFN